jgi:hypothetical protein
LLNDGATGLPDRVADKQDFHGSKSRSDPDKEKTPQ